MWRRRTDDDGNEQRGVYPRLDDDEPKARRKVKPKGTIAGGHADGGLSPKMPSFGLVLGRKRGKSHSPSRADDAAAAATAAAAARQAAIAAGASEAAADAAAAEVASVVEKVRRWWWW